MVKVHTDNANPSLFKVLITAKYAHVAVESETGSNASKAPAGKLPYLDVNETTQIFGDNAIVRYIARLGKGHLYGANDVEAGLIESFVSMSATDIDLPANVWIFPILGYISNNAQATERARKDIQKVLSFLNKHLATRTYLVGERITIADIAVSMSLYYLYQKVMDNNFRKGFINANRWFTTLVNQPEFKAVIGEFTFCTVAEVAKEGEVKKEEKKEVKKEEKKPAQKPTPKPAAHDDEEEDDAPVKEEKKNVLDMLPPSKLNLDEWKRTYSNKETRTEALPWLFQNLDLEGYSLWFCEYKYNDELEQVFKTCNLLNGFFQRLEKLRKYGFGSMCIFGTEPGHLSISGVWLFRGKEVPAEMTEVDDYVHYNFRRLDVSNTSDKALIEDYFAWDGSFGGRPFNQGKVYK